MGGEINAPGVWKRGSSDIGSSPNTAESSVIVDPLVPYPLP